MARSIRLFDFPKDKLNSEQRRAVKEFQNKGLTEADFANRAWFDRYSHYKAFRFLVKNKHQTFDQAFVELDGLDGSQAEAIFLGCSRNEVVGLSEDQIDTYLKYGLAKADLQNLNKYQIKALLALNKHGLQADDLRSIKHFKQQHLESLIFLVSVKKQNCQEAIASLQNISTREVWALRYGLEKKDVTGLTWRELKVLIKSKRHAGLQNRDQVMGLSKHQVNMVKNLFHYGLTSELAREFLLPNADKMQNVLLSLVKECGFTINEMLQMQQKYSLWQLKGIADGLAVQEVSGLNSYHICALIDCRTIKNKLSAQDLRGKSWFNSQEHIDILYALLLDKPVSYFDKRYSVRAALAKMDGLTGQQATYHLHHHKSREEVEGLTDIQLEALDSGKKDQQVTGQHLRGKIWFNSKEHVNALHKLICYFDLTVELALKELDGLTNKQAELLTLRDRNSERIFDRDKILKLSPLQLKILTNPGQGLYYDNVATFAEATWLTTEKQVSLLEELHRVRSRAGDEFTLAIVKKASDEPEGIDKLLRLIKAGEIGTKELKYLADPVKPPPAWLSKDDDELYNSERCSIM